MPVENVRIINGDTAVTPYGQGQRGSRTTTIEGEATRLAAQKAREELFRGAARLLECDPAGLDAREGRIFVKGTPGRWVSHADAYVIIHREDCKEVTATATYNSPCEEPDPATGYGNWSAAYSFGVKVAEVNVDTETGAVEVLRVVSATDAGTVVNPHAALGQIEGGVLMGVGYALMEDFQVENGQPVNPQLARLQTAHDAGRSQSRGRLRRDREPERTLWREGFGRGRPARHLGGHRQRCLRRGGCTGHGPSHHTREGAKCAAPEGGGSRLETSRGLNEHCGFGGAMMTLLGERERRAFGDIAKLFGAMVRKIWFPRNFQLLCWSSDSWVFIFSPFSRNGLSRGHL